MSVALNCWSIETARITVAEVVGVSEKELRGRLRSIAVPEHEEPCEYIAAKLLGVEIDRIPAPGHVHWFHATRVVDPDSFKRNGILTKSAARQVLLPLLRKLSEGILAEGHYPNSGSVMGKMAINDEGPFGFLLRSCAASASTHFYRAPESVEDIAGSLVGGNFLRVVERFQAGTVPCLVEFKAPGQPRHVARALWYAYLAEHGHGDAKAAECANTCFDGHGTAIPAAYVVAVEQLPAETGRLPVR